LEQQIKPMTEPKSYAIGNQTLVREINLSIIMTQLHEKAPVSRATLAEVTGLNKATVSSLVQELVDNHFIHEVGLRSKKAGRPAMLFAVNPNAGHIVSVEIGVDFIFVICTNFATEIIWQEQLSLQPELSEPAIIERTLQLLQQAIAVGTQKVGPVLGVALAVPGLVDQQSGTLIFAPNLGWRNVPLATLLNQALGANVPTFVDNEANLAALGEQFFGVGQGYKDVLYISATAGLGGAIMRNGQLFRGVTGFAGEIGHILMDPQGELCKCGNRGCWETQVSQMALFRYIRQSLAQGHPSLLSEISGGQLEQLTVPQVTEAAQAGDEVSLAALEKVGYHLGLGIASLINALNPDLVVLGGVLSLAGEFLLPKINQVLEQRVLHWSRQITPVVLAQHGSAASVMGGMALVYQTILAHPSNGQSKKAIF
jgi:glucokinase-like ROK family protein